MVYDLSRTMDVKEPVSLADLYEVLQVSHSADHDVIVAAYERLSKKYGADPDPDVRERRRLLDQAFAVLSDPEQRALYDRRHAGIPDVVVDRTPVVATPGRGVVACARDPEVQTALRCSRCETPICPKCMVQTPVGARCKACAQIARSPVYTMTTSLMIRAGVAAVIGGTVMGVIWGLVARQLAFTPGIFSMLFLGIALGWIFTRMMEFATGRKRGPVVAGFGMAGIAIAWGLQFLIVPGLAVFGLLAAGLGVYMCYQNLR